MMVIYTMMMMLMIMITMFNAIEPQRRIQINIANIKPPHKTEIRKQKIETKHIA